MLELTKIQSEVLAYIIDRIKKDYPPTHKEIIQHFGWSSSGAAKVCLLAQKKKGYIHCALKVSRGIILLPPALEWDNEGRKPFTYVHPGALSKSIKKAP